MIKGVGGRKYIEAILAQSNNVNIVEVYERKRINGFIAESDLKKNDNNYILASSKEAYDHFINFASSFILTGTNWDGATLNEVSYFKPKGSLEEITNLPHIIL